MSFKKNNLKKGAFNFIDLN